MIVKKLMASNNIKPILAREFIYVVILLLICLTVFKVGEYFQNSYETEINYKAKKLDDLPQHQLLWYKLKKYNLYNKSYTDFKKDYKNTESQIVLFYLVTNNGLFTKKFRDFRVKYFSKEAALDDSYCLFYNEYLLNDEYIQSQQKDFWIDLRKKEEGFKEMLKNDSVFIKLYSLFVKAGYKNSMEDYKNLIFEPYKEGLDIKEIDILEKSINNDKPKYLETAIKIIIFILILFYPLRFIVIGLKWSVKQIKN